MDKNSPLDFLLFESTGALFGDSDVNEVTLPDDTYGDDIRSEHEEFGGEGENEEHEELETPGEEALEHSDEPRDIISELLRKLSDLKEEITSKLKDKFPEGSDPEAAEALDDATSAIDLATHHLEDVYNKLCGESGGEGEGSVDEFEPESEPTEELEDMSMPSDEGAEEVFETDKLAESVKTDPLTSAGTLSPDDEQTLSYEPHKEVESDMTADSILSTLQKHLTSEELIALLLWADRDQDYGVKAEIGTKLNKTPREISKLLISARKKIADNALVQPPGPRRYRSW
ncbi:MAG: hypothetical protein WCO84_06340 [bacterium]